MDKYTNVTRKPVIEPAFDKNEILIMIGSSEYYVPYIGVLIQSIADNASPANNYDIVILADGITTESQSLLLMQDCLRGNISLRFFDIGIYLENYSFHTREYISRTSCARLLIPEITYGIDKALWIDGDTVVNHDLAELYATDLEDYFVGAIHDVGIRIWVSDQNWSPKELYSVLGVKIEDYFNTGVLLMNLALMRKYFTAQQMLETAARPDIKMIDQDALNCLCRGRVKYIPAAWNVLVTSYPSDEIPEELCEEIKSACREPYIIHYIGDCKPADNPSLPFYQYFWKYARRTPFYELLWQRYIDNKTNLMLNSSKEITKRIIESSVSKENFKQKLKRKLVMPIITIFFPKGSARRQKLKRWYFRLRDWSC